MKKMLSIGILLCLLCVIVLPTEALAAWTTETWVDEDGNEYTYFVDAWIDEEGNDLTLYIDADEWITANAVIVKLHPDWGDRECTIEDFSDVNCVGIVQELLFTDDGRYVTIKIGDIGLEYVYKAIEVLNARDDIVLAFPDEWFPPETGDTALIPAAIALLISGTGLAVLAIRRKKHMLTSIS